MPSKKVSMKASLVNRTSILGIMGGLAKGRTSGASGNRATNKLVIPRGAAAGLAYMRAHGILSRNPLGSGGVGRMNKVKSCNCQGSKQNSKEKIEENVDEGELVPAIGTGDSDCSFLNQQLGNDVRNLKDYAGTSLIYDDTQTDWFAAVPPTFPTFPPNWNMMGPSPLSDVGDAGHSATTCGEGLNGVNICMAVAAARDGDSAVMVRACYKNIHYECPAGYENIGGKCTQCSPGTFSKMGGTCEKCSSGTWSDAGASACSSGFCEPCQYSSCSVGGCTHAPGCYIIDSSYCCSKTTWDVSFGCTDANHVCVPGTWGATGQPECLLTNQNINCTPP
jgi:hypothetical protein